MSFMEPEVIQGYGYIVETNDGSSFAIPEAIMEEFYGRRRQPSPKQLMEYAPENVGQRHQSHERVRGFFAHLTAPGYLDQTDWEFFETQGELDEWLAEQEEDESDDDVDYGDEEDDEE